MPVCVECGHPVSSLFTEYSQGNIRLTPCSNCNLFADKYIEHNFLIIFTDLLLHKPQVYRHLLFNRLKYRDSGIDENVMKLGVLLLLFDVYVKWFRLEKGMGEELRQNSLNLALQYLYILSLCFLEFVIFHLVIRSAIYLFYGGRYAIIKWLVNFLVLTSNAEALSGMSDEDFIATRLTFSLLEPELYQDVFNNIDGLDIQGCVCCREMAFEMNKQREYLDSIGIKLIAVIKEIIDQDLQEFRNYFTGDIYLDPDMKLYASLTHNKIVKHSLLKTMTSVSVWKAIKRALSKGIKNGSLGGESTINGGFMLITRDGVKFQHNEDVGYLPPIDLILQSCKAAAQAELPQPVVERGNEKRPICNDEVCVR